MDNVPSSPQSPNGSTSGNGPIEVEAVPIESSQGGAWSDPRTRGNGHEAYEPWTQGGFGGQGGGRVRVVKLPSFILLLPLIVFGIGVILLFKFFGFFLLALLGILWAVLRMNVIRAAVVNWLIRKMLARRGMR